MGLTSAALRYIIRCQKKHKLIGPVLTLGNQDIYATEQDVVRWCHDAGVKAVKPEAITYATSQGLQKLNPRAKQFIHAKTFFEMMGISKKDYYDMDKFDFDKPSILQDLQDPIDSRFHDFFNLIIDSGTIEHVFDIRAVMSNIVAALKKGGYCLHLTPAANMLNHGFYQFSPTFFYDFYTTNGFEIVESHLIEVCGSCYRFHRYEQSKDYAGMFLNAGHRLMNCFLVKKVSSVKACVAPGQYYYELLAKDENKVVADFTKTFFDRCVVIIRKIIPIRFHGVFFDAWQTIKCMLHQKDYFDIRN